MGRGDFHQVYEMYSFQLSPCGSRNRFVQLDSFSYQKKGWCCYYDDVLMNWRTCSSCDDWDGYDNGWTCCNKIDVAVLLMKVLVFFDKIPSF